MTVPTTTTAANVATTTPAKPDENTSLAQESTATESETDAPATTSTKAEESGASGLCLTISLLFFTSYLV